MTRLSLSHRYFLFQTNFSLKLPPWEFARGFIDRIKVTNLAAKEH